MEWLVYTEHFLQFPVYNKCCIGFAISISLSLAETTILYQLWQEMDCADAGKQVANSVLYPQMTSPEDAGNRAAQEVTEPPVWALLDCWGQGGMNWPSFVAREQRGSSEGFFTFTEVETWQYHSLPASSPTKRKQGKHEILSFFSPKDIPDKHNTFKNFAF